MQDRVSSIQRTTKRNPLAGSILRPVVRTVHSLLKNAWDMLGTEADINLTAIARSTTTKPSLDLKTQEGINPHPSPIVSLRSQVRLHNVIVKAERRSDRLLRRTESGLRSHPDRIASRMMTLSQPHVL